MAPKRKRPRAGAGSRSRSRNFDVKPPKRTQQLLAVPPPPIATETGSALTIAGIGASAGGLESFSTLLQALPASPGLALVFVQHLAPQYESALVPLLSSQSELPVVQATHGMVVEANHVYVFPPNAQMSIVDRTLHLNERPDDRSQYTPVDAFLSSLAEAAGPRAIGIILSGAASDGSLGVRYIKAAGGVTIAQTPESATYDGMPRAAIGTGRVDLILPPKQIGAKLAELCRHASFKMTEKATTDLPVTADELHQVFEVLRPVGGVDFRHYKLPTIKRRLFRRMALHRLNEVCQYVRLLRRDPSEVRSLYQDLLIHVTRFFREPESFEALTRDVFPAIVQGRPQDQAIRVWVSGCATGEEAYSLAISLVEFLQKHQLDIPVQIFATDVSEMSIEQARTGVYPPSLESDVGADRLRRFFTKHDGGYRVTKMIRDLCVFARQDLTKDPPFSRLDLVLCRNVLIYMDVTLQKKLLSLFHYALNANGFLVLGQAETVASQVTLFSLVDRKFRVHRKKPATGTPTMTFPVDDTNSGLPAKKTQAESAGAETLLPDRSQPPDHGPLRPAGRRGRQRHAAATGGTHYLVFDEPLSSATRKKAPETPPPKTTRRERKSQVHFLQRELAASREYLQSIIQELEAANEELQSANEEIVSSNEALQSTNEELQSTNEELNTVNEELHGRNEELSRLNSDLVNLLGSVQIAIVIVSADLRIRRFTPMAEKVLHLIPTDIGRLIAHINPNIIGANLTELIVECIDSISSIERDVQDRQGRWYSLRIRPYRVENKIDGAVVALFDVDAPKRYEEAMRAAAALADAVVQVSPGEIAILDAELRLRSAGPRFTQMFSIATDRWRDRVLSEFMRSDGFSELQELVQRDGSEGKDHVSVTLHPSGNSHPIAVDARSFSSFDIASRRMLLLTVADVRMPPPPQ